MSKKEKHTHTPHNEHLQRASNFESVKQHKYAHSPRPKHQRSKIVFEYILESEPKDAKQNGTKLSQRN